MPRAKKTEAVTELGTWSDDKDDDTGNMLRVKEHGSIRRASKPKKAEPVDPATKSDVTQLVEAEISRDQDRWRQAAADAANTGVFPQNEVLIRLGVAFNMDSFTAKNSFADDVKAIKSHRSAVIRAEKSLKKKQAFFKEHGDLQTLRDQLEGMESDVKELKKLLHMYHHAEAQGTQWQAPKIEATHRRIWPLNSNPNK